MPHVYRSRWLISDAFHVHQGAALVVGDGGRIEALLDEHTSLESRRRVDALECTELGDGVLMPGLVNAHAHLELSGLRLEPAADFGEWLTRVLEARASLQPADYSQAVQDGARRLLETGTTTVGDLDSSGASEASLPALPLRARIFREVLDAGDPQRCARQIDRLHEPWQLEPHISAGLAPHAPHTVSDDLLGQCAMLAAEAGLPLTTHWAETEQECEWLSEGTGVFANLLGESPHCSGLQRLQRAGLLGPNLSLVHGNFPEPGNLEQLASSGASLVLCPGSHRYFERPALPLEIWAASGLQIGIGTDSLASNDDLDMRREMSLIRREHPGLDAAVVFDWATRGSARALALESQVGELAVGKWADFVALDGTGLQSPRDAIEAVTSALPAVQGVWVGGRQV